MEEEKNQFAKQNELISGFNEYTWDSDPNLSLED